VDLKNEISNANDNTDKTGINNIEYLPCITRLDIPTDRCLRGALNRENLESVIIIGETIDGDIYFSSSQGSGPNVLWLLEQAKQHLLNT
jgi:hypothetical protein